MRTTLAPYDDAVRAAALNAVYAQYLMPFSMTPEQTRRHIESTSIDPARSRLWLDGAGDVQAIVALGIRAPRGTMSTCAAASQGAAAAPSPAHIPA